MGKKGYILSGAALLAALTLLAGCGGEKAEEERTSGLYYEACGISPDAVRWTLRRRRRRGPTPTPI